MLRTLYVQTGKAAEESQALAEHTEIPNRPINTARGRRTSQRGFLLPEHGAGQGKAREATDLCWDPSSRLQFEGANGVQGQCTAQVMPKNKTQGLESKRKGREVSKAVFQRAFQIMINTEKCLSMQGEPGAHTGSQIYAFVSSAFLIQTSSSSRLNNVKSHPRGLAHHKAVYSPNTDCW